ncbi:heavy metal-associated domain-containing protein [Kiritimatiellota bacterium B12222]|nr:heavy metal-associated domain-containing protein [Kiritimatiellota bacterium B12222]
MKKALLLIAVLLPLFFAGCAKESLPPETIELSVKGMTCQDCVDGITGAVTQLPGVSSCTVSLEDENAVIAFAPNKLTAEQIEKRINQLGFKASISEH